MIALLWMQCIFYFVQASRILNVDNTETVLAVENEEVVLNCQDDVPMSYCSFEHPNGTRYSFAGASLNSGICEKRFSVRRNDSGTWKCHIGAKNKAGVEIVKKKYLNVGNKIIALKKNIKVIDRETMLVECVTAKDMIPLSYCRFEPPNGNAFSITQDVTVNSSILQNYYFPENRSLNRGDCAVVVKKVTYEHKGIWICGAWIDGDQKEYTDYIDVTVEGIYKLSTASAAGIGSSIVIMVLGTLLILFIYYVQRRGRGTEEDVELEATSPRSESQRTDAWGREVRGDKYGEGSSTRETRVDAQSRSTAADTKQGAYGGGASAQTGTTQRSQAGASTQPSAARATQSRGQTQSTSTRDTETVCSDPCPCKITAELIRRSEAAKASAQNRAPEVKKQPTTPGTNAYDLCPCVSQSAQRTAPKETTQRKAPDANSKPVTPKATQSKGQTQASIPGTETVCSQPCPCGLTVEITQRTAPRTTTQSKPPEVTIQQTASRPNTQPVAHTATQPKAQTQVSTPGSTAETSSKPCPCDKTPESTQRDMPKSSSQSRAPGGNTQTGAMGATQSKSQTQPSTPGGPGCNQPCCPCPPTAGNPPNTPSKKTVEDPYKHCKQ